MKILVIAPHADDGEIGCGGTIARLAEEGHTIFYLVFASVDPKLSEVQNGLKALSIPSSSILYAPMEIREFTAHRQELLEHLIEYKESICPDLVFVPSTKDTHQDHKTVTEECFRAFKKCSLLGYEIPWNNLHFTTNHFVELTESHVIKKFKAVYCHESQRDKDYISENFIFALASVRGVQIGVRYAEVFESIRWVSKIGQS